jgi:hypothetical protein
LRSVHSYWLVPGGKQLSMGKKKGSAKPGKHAQAAPGGTRQAQQAKTAAVDISHQHASRIRDLLHVRTPCASQGLAQCMLLLVPVDLQLETMKALMVARSAATRCSTGRLWQSLN